MKNNLNDIQVFYQFLYRSYTKEDFYESVYYNLWQYYRSVVRDLYIGKHITYDGKRYKCTDLVSFGGVFSLIFKECSSSSIGALSLAVGELKGVNFE